MTDTRPLEERTERRPWGRYLTPTLLKGFLAGDHFCEWKLWFSANFKFEYQPMAPEDAERLNRWRKDHDERVESLCVELEGQGWKVSREHRVQVKFPDKTTLRGDIDCLAQMDEFTHVWDVKTGRRRVQDEEQVRIYLAVLAKTDRFKTPLLSGGMALQGMVRYNTGDPVEVHPDEGDYPRIVALVKAVSASKAPPRTATYYECRYCKIADCPDRAEKDSGSSTWR